MHKACPLQQASLVGAFQLLGRRTLRRLSRPKASGGDPIGPLEALKLACEREGIQLLQDHEDNEETWEDLLEDEEIVWDPTLELAEARPADQADDRSALQLSEAAHMSVEEFQTLKSRGARICALDVSLPDSIGDVLRTADELEATTLRHVPLEDLHADAAAQLREFDHVVILAMLRDDRRAWQAWVRLTKVFRLQHVGILVQ
ncbi:g4552 [Coccomyxa viridis]|uniref:G4552 protein n=1 Tax=Coccomyxa viridis TaxID=1274662 RepID=A0ABP1FQJ6_9CHLO